MTPLPSDAVANSPPVCCVPYKLFLEVACLLITETTAFFTSATTLVISVPPFVAVDVFVVSTCVCEGCVAGVVAWFAGFVTAIIPTPPATATAPPTNPPIKPFLKDFDDFFLVNCSCDICSLLSFVNIQ